MKIARIAPHFWEEPCISGTKGSGTIFFSGCTLGCIFCQNHTISRTPAGKDYSPQALAEAMLHLQAQGVHNINLVTAAHYRPWVTHALKLARGMGLVLPVAWNTGGYESVESIQALEKDVDIWLFDLKFRSSELARLCTGREDYFQVASKALQQACLQTGPPRFDEQKMLQSGVILRILVLPGYRQDAKDLLHWVAQTLPAGHVVLSLMRQYTPPAGLQLPAPLHRRLASYEYNDVLETALQLGFLQGYTQDAASAKEQYVPPFDV